MSQSIIARCSAILRISINASPPGDLGHHAFEYYNSVLAVAGHHLQDLLGQMNIREATEKDFDEIWPIFHEVVSAGDTYAYPQDTSKEDALKIWIHAPRKTFVIEDDHKVLGTYYLKTNQAGPGNQVCNCGCMVASDARGKGLATTMCEHSQKVAVALGYKAMQFNFVASTNEGAVRLCTRLGFEVVGNLPKAFNHPGQGYVDALVMFKWLE